MVAACSSCVLRAIPFLIAVCIVSIPAYAKYSGGTGDPNDPYQIATAEDLMLLGETPEDYNKHFILTSDIDLGPNLPGGKVFDKAVIAPDTDAVWDNFQGTPFTGVFDGNNYVIRNLHINGNGYLGLFGRLGNKAKISNLGLEAVDVYGTGDYIGGLVGYNSGNITSSYSTSTVNGDDYIGGLVGCNSGSIILSYSTSTVNGDDYIGGLVGYKPLGSITLSYSTGTVNGDDYIGGLVGYSVFGSITSSDSTCTVNGNDYIGGLVGFNQGDVTDCYSTGMATGNSRVGGLMGHHFSGNIILSYSTGTVRGNNYIGGLVGSTTNGSITTCYGTGRVVGSHAVGGLVGHNRDSIAMSYSTGTVTGAGDVGGLVGSNSDSVADSYSTGTVSGSSIIGGLVGRNSGSITTSYSTGAVRSTIPSMTRACGLVGSNLESYSSVTSSFWDMETSGSTYSNGGTGKTTAEMQTAATYLKAGWDFERVWTINEGVDYPKIQTKYGGGIGTANDPYQIATSEDLILLGASPEDYHKHFILTADISLNPNLRAGKVFFNAVVAPDTIEASSEFQGTPFTGVLDGQGYTISNLTITGDAYLGLFGQLGYGAEVKNLGVINSSITGVGWNIGCLVGNNSGGTVTNCYSTGTVSGTGWFVGGLVGDNNNGSIHASYSNSMVIGEHSIGGLAGANSSGSNIAACYSTGMASGNHSIGGLVGLNEGSITESYSVSTVAGDEDVGGLVGDDSDQDYGNQSELGSTNSSFWDMETSGQSSSAGGTGKTTSEMQMDKTFLEAGWDFVDETANGTEDTWLFLEEQDYPRLRWILFPGKSSYPDPYNGALGIGTSVTFSWRQGSKAFLHDVYLGTDGGIVANADTSEPTGVYRGRQATTSYTPPEGIKLRTTPYYWRIDEIDNKGHKTKGDVWTFTTIPPPKGRACFTSEINVWANGVLTPISNVGPGQDICLMNCLYRIEEVQEHNGIFACYDVFFESGNCLSIAEDHYFLAESGRWISLHNLKAGTRLITTKGTVAVKNITKKPKLYIGKVYNLKIDGSDRYMVGEDAIVVRDY